MRSRRLMFFQLPCHAVSVGKTGRVVVTVQGSPRDHFFVDTVDADMFL